MNKNQQIEFDHKDPGNAVRAGASFIIGPRSFKGRVLFVYCSIVYIIRMCYLLYHFL